ncbi:DUF6197 family protein [Streptomyces acidicola]|uniref:Uncharacterized protein n=1 Tax=Streptomyces acidicola TaxID=2596892 RepID=A0A5N8WJ56_9ACTN|nr:hypothetical protein [Streptomyces acidicola]MPY47132.1 hypothetical protein [Streptomyces acidicola]MPY47271.1 hypothetical protein [Streptomyces acidicola]
MTAKTLTPSASATAAKPLDFDERLTLAALAVDARTDTTPLDLADVIRIPERAPRSLTPTSAPCPYNTPIAGLLYRARQRLEQGGWCTGALRDEQGAACLVGAIRAEAASRGQADDACVLLLEAIRRDFRDVESIPSWNDARRDPRLPLLYLDRAATLAHARTL